MIAPFVSYKKLITKDDTTRNTYYQKFISRMEGRKISMQFRCETRSAGDPIDDRLMRDIHWERWRNYRRSRILHVIKEV